MSEIASNATSEWETPDFRAAPAAFRTAMKVLRSNWDTGNLDVVMPGGRRLRLRGAKEGPAAELIIKDYKAVGRVMSGADIGFAEGYMAGEWDTPDLPALLTAFTWNLDRIGRLMAGNPLVKAWNFLIHFMRRNDREGSRRNIHAHYDLGNRFYELWLDRTMTYSSARFERADQPLEEAQHEKYAALARSIELKSDQTVLEIGCGWGGFAEFAAKEVGARVTGITISQAQYDYARERLFKQGLAEKADIQLIDYRDVQGRFDRVASIEMFEAVGEEYWPTYFGKIHEVLSPGGRAGLQIITIKDELFEHYRAHADFIQKYVFPGGMLPSEEKLKAQTDRAGLDWTGLNRFGECYADTLNQWLHRFDAVWEQVKAQGFDERFRKLWRFYLAYCEAGMRTGRTNVVQLGLSRA
ncbi:cyclopropane-fatty-acyl-phospholipid synthase family protein [Caulobacter sp. NIBR1757]|uniref:SAM-dependent methyltransferase n=1 Tax=Caulobacter sp. NIBR1757 TaxID=3016000 RepID=UPI0022F07575|nr:cyclopropane-fatty-acyl-phospholipid synthase family protein [Caulobacter sp. NIBR1757]WGM38874.1 Tuberculostearic acid methyltransferase UfaA1 [Caulobacter sp. NIBR1757]